MWPDFKAVVASLGTQVSYMDQCGIALADGRECGLWYARRDADLFHPPLRPVSRRERRSWQARAGQDVPPGRFSDYHRYVAREPRSLLWVRSRTNSFIGSIGKSALSGMRPVCTRRYPTPPFFVSVDFKGVSVSISHLFSTLTREFTSVDSKAFRLHQNCASPRPAGGECMAQRCG